MKQLIIVTQHDADSTVITVAGEIDLASCPALEEAVRVIPPGGRTVCLEMSGVPFMDSTGLTFLLKLRRRLLAEGGRLCVAGLQEQPVSVLRLTQTYPLLVTGAAGTV